MLTDKQMETLKKIATRLRELTPYLDRISSEIEEERILLPERHWRTEIDDEMSANAGALDEARLSITDAINSIAEVTGEDEEPVRTRATPLPETLPSYNEVDAQRRVLATAIRERRKQ